MRKTLIISLAAATILTGGAIQAQSQDRGAMRGMELTREATQQRATQLFERLDLNSDGQIDDSDRDARQQVRFERLDADGSGAVDLAEFTTAREQRREMRQERRAARAASDEPREMRRGRGMRRSLASLRGMGEQADTDGNGAISQSEFMGAVLARFDAADADGNGTITREERRSARMHGQRHQSGQAG